MCDLSPTQGVSVRVGRNAPCSRSLLRSVRSMKGVSLDAQSSTYSRSGNGYSPDKIYKRVVLIGGRPATTSTLRNVRHKNIVPIISKQVLKAVEDNNYPSIWNTWRPNSRSRWFRSQFLENKARAIHRGYVRLKLLT